MIARCTTTRSSAKAKHQGFTLIELLIVVVIIGILAAIAIPKFANTKEKAYMASMKSDLRNLVTAQEAYFSDRTSYTTTGGLGAAFAQSSGVTVTVTTALGTGWRATAQHNATTRTCFIYVGSEITDTGGAIEGEPRCA
jgi:prepilin-type N-terminal cleavage/methylation domain-containing protein